MSDPQLKLKSGGRVLKSGGYTIGSDKNAFRFAGGFETSESIKVNRALDTLIRIGDLVKHWHDESIITDEQFEDYRTALNWKIGSE